MFNALQLEPAAAKYKSRASCCKVTAASKFIVLQHYVYYVYVNPFKQSGVSVLGRPLSVLQSLATLGDPYGGPHTTEYYRRFCRMLICAVFLRARVFQKAKKSLPLRARSSAPSRRAAVAEALASPGTGAAGRGKRGKCERGAGRFGPLMGWARCPLLVEIRTLEAPVLVRPKLCNIQGVSQPIWSLRCPVFCQVPVDGCEIRFSRRSEFRTPGFCK